MNEREAKVSMMEREITDLLWVLGYKRTPGDQRFVVEAVERMMSGIEQIEVDREYAC